MTNQISSTLMAYLCMLKNAFSKMTFRSKIHEFSLVYALLSGRLEIKKDRLCYDQCHEYLLAYQKILHAKHWYFHCIF